MGSELRQPDEMLVTLSNFLLPSITIQTSVGLADVSFWQDVIDFTVMRSAGLAGVIIRAGQRTWVDSRFKENWEKAKTARIPRGSYWFYDSREDPKKQAALWASLVQGDVGELVHACDFEESYSGAYGEPSHFKQFILEFQRLTGLPDSRIVIYTGHFWWRDRVGNDIFFRRFALWLAWYADMSVVRVPMPWHESELLLWQYTSSGNGTAYGVSSREIDLNWYAGDAISFTRRFALEVEPPGNGGAMSQWYRVNTAVLNIRDGAGAGNADIGDLLLNDRVEAEGAPVNGWLHIVRILRAGQTTPAALDGWCSGAYCVVTAAPVIDPPTEPPVVVFPPEIGITIGGVTKAYIPKP